MSNELKLREFAIKLFTDNAFVFMNEVELEHLAIEHGIIEVVGDPENDEELEAIAPARWLTSPIEYIRPELTNDDRQQAEDYARKVFRKYGVGKVVIMVASLCLENIRLVKEVNEHRAARGIDPLPTFEV